MSVPDGVGFRLISKAIEKYRKNCTSCMVYAELYETVNTVNDTTNTSIEPGNYMMYIDRNCIHDLETYELVIIKNGIKHHCSIYDILKTELVKDL
jgi:hypothetical protein